MISPTPSEGSRSRCTTAVKVPLFALNLVTWICGGGLIGIGIWVITTENEYKHFVRNQNIYIVYMCLSVVLFTAGIFGACGVLAGNKVLLQLYFAILCLVFCALFGMVVFGVVRKSLVNELIHKNWNSTSDETRIFIQNKFDCCGISDNVTYIHESNQDDSCFVNKTNWERKQNCLEKLIEWFDEHQMTIAIVGATIMLIMLALMVSSCWLTRQLGTTRRTLKKTRVVPITIEENRHNQVTNFSDDGRDRDRGRNSEMVPVDELGEGSYERKGTEKKVHRQKTGRKWAKNNAIY